MAINDASILDSVKTWLDVGEGDNSFDESILMEINTVFSQLFQLGVGPTTAYAIEDATAKWSDFIGNNNAVLMVKTYMKDSIRMSWDPPQTAYALEAMQKRIEKHEWRLQVAAEELARDTLTISTVTPDPNDPPVTFFTGG